MTHRYSTMTILYIRIAGAVLTKPLTKHTHDLESQPAREGAATNESRACVCRLKHESEFCDDVRIAYARNRHGVTNPVGYANAPDARAGLYDEAVREWLATVESPARCAPQRDTSACPDCAGTEWWHPGGHGRGAAKCAHPRLIDAGDPSPPATGRIAARSP